MCSTKSFCEIYIRKILPVAKAYLAFVLVKKYGLSQLKVAKMLNMKQSAVNYAVTGRRRVKYSNVIDKIPELKSIFDEMAKQIYGGVTFYPCNLCNKLTRDRSLLANVINSLGEGEANLMGPY